jgi:hypothetical protein
MLADIAAGPCDDAGGAIVMKDSLFCEESWSIARRSAKVRVRDAFYTPRAAGVGV